MVRADGVSAALLLLLAADVAHGSPGVIGLDSLTFDKVVGAGRPAFVRFDQEYPVGLTCFAGGARSAR